MHNAHRIELHNAYSIELHNAHRIALHNAHSIELHNAKNIISQSMYTQNIHQVQTMYQIISPAAIIVSGPSGCGKTTLIKDLIRYKKELFSIEPTRVVYYYAIYQSVFDSMPGVEFIQGRPMSLEPFRTDEHVLIIIDDQMLELLNDEITATLFISSCHHDCNCYYRHTEYLSPG